MTDNLQKSKMTASVAAVNRIGSCDATPEPLLKIEEAARILGRTHWTLRQDIKAGKLRYVRLGRRIMIEPAEIRRLIEKGRGTLGINK